MSRKVWLLAAAAASVFMVCGENNDNGTQVSDAQPRNVTVQIINISDSIEALSSGTFGDEPVPPGQAVTFLITAPEGSKLSFTTMFGESNDWFYAPNPWGIELYDEEGQPITKDITDSIFLWDAGTEANEPIGSGENQAPRQSGPNTGPEDESKLIRQVADGRYTADNVMQATVRSQGDNTFLVTLRVLPTSQTSLTPGVYAVHRRRTPIFRPGSADPGNGLEAQAEDGNPTQLSEYVASVTGVATVLSSGVWAVSDSDAVLFSNGDTVSSGLEKLAEDGNPSTLVDELEQRGITAGTFGNIGLGDTVTFTIEVSRGDRLYFATMFDQSNDLFFAPGQNGISLTSRSGSLVTGDLSDDVEIWDAGTEVNEPLGLGPNQAPRQAVSDTGEDENGVLKQAGNETDLKAANSYIKVIITEGSN